MTVQQPARSAPSLWETTDFRTLTAKNALAVENALLHVQNICFQLFLPQQKVLLQNVLQKATTNRRSEKTVLPAALSADFVQKNVQNSALIFRPEFQKLTTQNVLPAENA